MLSRNHDTILIQHQLLSLYDKIMYQRSKGQISLETDQKGKFLSVVHYLKTLTHPESLMTTADNS